MKTQLFALILGLTTVFGLQAESFRSEQRDQVRRIHQGRRSGELTRGETWSLYGREAALRREYAQDRRDGGRFSPAERRKLDFKQERLSRSIYRQKHDWQNR